MILRILLIPLAAVALTAFVWFVYRIFALGLKEFFRQKGETTNNQKKNK